MILSSGKRPDMKILQYPLGQMQANCYFILNDNQCLIIDPADDAPFILEELQRRNLKLAAMMATHGHFDHLMAAGEIQLSLKVPLYINFKDCFLLDRLSETAEYFLGHKLPIIKPSIIKDINTEKEFKLDNWEMKIIHSPGHTPGGSCFYFEKEKIVFAGDTLFKNGIGRYDFSYSNKKLLYQSINNILKLPSSTIIYSGHGEETTVEVVKKLKVY